MMLRILLLIFFLVAFTKLSCAQVPATTESGNKVLLFDNGTWRYDEESINATENIALTSVLTIHVDSSKEIATDLKELFYLPSERLVKYFGLSGGNIRCKLSCSNSFGMVKVHFMWEFPVSDGVRYFGWLKEGSKVTFTMDDGQMITLIMADESNMKSFENNYSMISNVSQSLTNEQLAALCARPFRKIAVEWKKKPEEYDVQSSRYLMDTLPKVF